MPSKPHGLTYRNKLGGKALLSLDGEKSQDCLLTLAHDYMKTGAVFCRETFPNSRNLLTKGVTEEEGNHVLVEG